MRDRWVLMLCSVALSVATHSASAEQPSTTQPAPFLNGYTDQTSYAPGESVAFHVSTNLPHYNVRIARIGATKEFVWERSKLAGGEHPIPGDASSRGCGWPVTFTFTIPAEWRSGYYEVHTGIEDPRQPDRWFDGDLMFFIVRPGKTDPQTRILLQLPTNTYNAYGHFGGQSLYPYNSRDEKPSPRVSFRRPIDTDASLREIPFIQWAEKNGYRMDYAANSDLEFHPELLNRYRLVLSVGHDEYWSAPMRDRLEAFIAKGGNAAFLAGNVSCWQVRFEDDGATMVSWKRDYLNDPLYRKGGPNPLLTAHWSDPIVGRPENLLTGVGYAFGGFHRSNGYVMDGRGAFRVHRPDHWIFAGTGLRDGDEFGGKHQVVGYECDGCEFELRDGKPYPTGRDGTPKDFSILATAPAQWPADDLKHDPRWDPHRMGAACLGVRTHPGGGTVFTAATTDWSRGLLGGDPAVERITRNVLDRLTE